MAPKAQKKIEIPADGSAFVAPDGISAADLQALHDQITAQAEELLGDDDATAEQIAGAEWLLGARQVVKDKVGELDAAAEAKAQALQAARDKLNPTAEADADTEPTDEAAADTRDGDKPAGDIAAVVNAGDANDPSAATAGEPALVASARQSAVAAAAAAAPAPRVRPKPKGDGDAYLTAAADIPGYSAGGKLDWDAFGKAASKRFGQLPNYEGGPTVTLPIGDLHIPTLDSSLVASGGKNPGEFVDEDEAKRAMDWACAPKRLAQETGQESLVAAGGWCAPSETLYDLLDFTTDDGLVSLPGITVNRGGVRYALGPNFATVYSTAAWTRTEAQAIAGTPTKPVVNIPCPAFTDNRMLVDGMFFTGDILTSKGYPEAYTDFTTKAMKAFAHYVNKQIIADVQALATTVTIPAANTTGSATTEILGAVEVTIVDMRYRNRMSMTQAVEIILPYWTKGLLRSDLAKRQGIEDGLNISDDDITRYFAVRGASVQFVYDYQDFFASTTGFGNSSAAVAWPTAIEFLAYPQGGVVSALNDVIELKAVYDSTLLATNQYVALFLEQARLTLARAWDIRKVQIASPGIPNTGAAGLIPTITQPSV